MADGLDQIFAQAVARHQQGDLAGATGLYRMLLGLRPNAAALHVNLGIALQMQGKLEEAAGCFQKAVELEPALAEAHNSLGCVLTSLGRLEEAEASLRRAIALAPTQAQASNNLGNALRQQGKIPEAIEAYRTAASLDPTSPQPLCNLSALLLESGDGEGALSAANKALALDPHQPEAWNCLGNAHLLADRVAEAEVAFRQAGTSPEAGSNLGALLYDLYRFEETEAQARAVIAAHPNYAAAYTLLGNALMAQNKLAEAETAFQRAVDLAPAEARYRLNLSSALLKQGKFKEGWQAYEARRLVPWSPIPNRTLGLPNWQGEALPKGQWLMLHAEQGFGDCLQFCRYALDLSVPVVLVVEPQLKRLMNQNFGHRLKIVAYGEPVPEGLAAQAPLMSLPHLLGHESIPATPPYLSADAGDWPERLAALPGKKVGLVWAGAPRPYSKIAHLLDKRRSIPLKMLESLGDVEGVSLISLQKGEAGGETVPGLQLHDFTAELADFADTASLIMALDLVIAVDSAVAHLAAALGKPVWMLSRFDGCWRWLEGRDDTPWYPSMRLFRQETQGDWAAVVERVRKELT